MSHCPHFLVFFKVKIEWKFAESIRPIFYWCYIFNTFRAGGPFALKTWSTTDLWLFNKFIFRWIIFINLSLESSQMYGKILWMASTVYYFGIIWVIPPIFLNCFHSNVKLVDLLRPIFHRFYIFKNLWERASLTVKAWWTISILGFFRIFSQLAQEIWTSIKFII